MKHFSRILAAVALLGALVAVVGVGPRATLAAGPAQSSTINVLNLSNSDATIQVFYYNPDGSLATMASGYSNPDNDTIPANAFKAYNPIRAAPGFNGSVVIASTQEIAVVSNITIASPASAVGSYVGIKAGGPKVYFPLVMKGNAGNTTNFNVQNTGASAVNISIQFVPEPGSSYASIPTVTDTIQPGAAKTYDQATMSQFSSVTKWVGSATVTATSSGGTIAGVANIVNSSNANAYRLSTYNAFGGGSTTVLAPLIQEANNGNRTSVNCQNLGSTPTTINVAYTPEPGNPNKASESKSNIVPNGIAVFLQLESGAQKFVGSATITSSPAVPLACVINQTRSALGRASSYEGFDPSTATTKIVVPVLQGCNGSTTNGFNSTTVNVASVDGTAANFTIDYKPEPGITDPPTANKSGATAVFNQALAYNSIPCGQAGQQKFVGGAVVTADKPIVAVVNLARAGGPYTVRDTLATYDAFNVAP
jgi:hypothetical protein